MTNTVIDQSLRSHYIDPEQMSWSPTPFPGIQIKVLYTEATSGMSTVLFKMDAGAVVPFHEHTGLEQTFMLEGSLEDEEGKAFPGTYVWRPAGSQHIAVAPNGALFLSMFMRPNHFFSGEKYDYK